MQRVDSETGSSTDLQGSSVAANDTRGKHRILAELKRLEQETRFLEQELEELEKTQKIAARLGNQTGSATPKQMALQTPHGIDGLKAPKIRKVADAGYFDCHPFQDLSLVLPCYQRIQKMLHYRHVTTQLLF
ncbi:hypothetical protein HHK36_012717 [Tetracentron sinense]|uniref:Uncharacterized protein n=1 Tax=Tetracentron sinense TaxID=13715 RepID=A0A834Z9L9_TETSI|nr:hypothetical protein HHK36_012717 [Tetracentron sinense]